MTATTLSRPAVSRNWNAVSIEQFPNTTFPRQLHQAGNEPVRMKSSVNPRAGTAPWKYFILAMSDLSEFTNDILITVSLLTKVWIPTAIKTQENKLFRCSDTEQSAFTPLLHQVEFIMTSSQRKIISEYTKRWRENHRRQPPRDLNWNPILRAEENLGNQV